VRNYAELLDISSGVKFKKLAAREHHGNWLDQDIEELKSHLLSEVAELIDAFDEGGIEDQIDEAADVSNIADMIIHKLTKAIAENPL